MQLSAPLRLCAMISAFMASSLCPAQDLIPKAAPQSRPVMIYNATIHPVSGPPIADGFVTFDQGKINGLGTIGAEMDIEKNKAAGWLMIDAKGKHIYPGLIAPYSQIGLTEIAAVRATLDMGEVGQATPEVHAAVAINPDSTLIPVARTNGIMLAAVFPLTSATGQLAYFAGPGGLVPGRASIVRLDGWTTEQMAAQMDAGLVINWPNMRPITAWWMDKSKEDQQGESNAALAVIERLFTDAAAYGAAKAHAPGGPTDLRLEAMRSVFPNTLVVQRPVFVLANDYDQITSAIAFGDKYKLKIIIVGGMDAPLAAALLKARDIPVIITGVYRFPKRADGDHDEPFAMPAKLKAAGVRFCLASGEEAANERNLPYAAATAVAHGLDRDEALRAITLSAATILGVSDRYGSIELDKSATLIIADGDILEITTNIDHAWIDGRKIDLSNKQTELEKKYREKYRQLVEPAP